MYFSLFLIYLCYSFKGVPMESQPTKLVGSIGSKNRYFDFDKLAEVWFILFLNCLLSLCWPYINIPMIFLRSLFPIALFVQVTAIVTTNLNKIIDVNYYPVETAKRSNLRHRPIGIGVQGLADTFILLGMAFDSPEVKLLCYSMCFLFDLINYLGPWLLFSIAGPAVEQGYLWDHILPCIKGILWTSWKRRPIWNI